MKKLFALLLALIMVMSLATTAFAADQTTGKVINETNRTYAAYQIFSGTQGDDAVLGDISWGSSMGSSGDLSTLCNALKDLEINGNKPFSTLTGWYESAAETAAILAANQNLAQDFANFILAYVKTVAATIPANETATLPSGYYLMVDTSTTNPTQNPALLQVTNGEMNITEKLPGVPTPDKKIVEGDNKTLSTTANIGDTITFELKATLPDSFENFESYRLTFVDTLSKGLTFNNDVEVFVDGTKVNCFTSTPAAGENESTIITIKNNDDNILNDNIAAGSVITVTYSAILNDDAVIGSAGNPNDVVLQYSNNPNKTTDFKTTPPPPTVKVYTWEIPVFKYTGTDTAKTPLAGAGFTLYTDANCRNAVNLVNAGNNVYKVCTLTGCTDHTHVENSEIVTDDTGRFKIQGLKSGTYYLKETTTPPGYNTCANVKVVIDENGALTQNGTTTTEVGVLNNTGTTLPETGGMGTTLFYIFGGIMMLGALILLVTKKRMADAV